MDNHHDKGKKYIPIPHHTYKKSLTAFKKGLDEMEKPKPRNRVALVASIGAIGVAGVLALALAPTFDSQDKPAEPVEMNRDEDIENSEFDIEEIEEIEIDEIGVNEDLLSDVFVREPFDVGSSSHSWSIHREELMVMVLEDWIVNKEEIEHGTKTIINGTTGLNQTILIFDSEATQDEMEQAKSDLLADYVYTEATVVPTDQLASYMENHPVTDGLFMLGFEERFAIELDEETKMVTMINEPEGRLYDYVEATLFDKKLIFFSEVPTNHSSQLAATYYTLSSITPSDDYEVSKGPYDQKHGRPTFLTMVMGGFQWEFVDLHLYEHELGFTSYIREGATLEKIERNGFTEWRFSDESTKEHRYYSFGKIDPSIPLEDIKRTLIDGYGLDHKGVDGLSEIMFSHRENPDTENEIGRSFELVQKQGEWYYIYTEDDHSEGFVGPSLWGLANKFQQEIIFE
ncbi:hypothetical protein [Alkalicoccobacillus porphyridii]|uniref:Uncharacterized protein n=1 Tax=Alkalicoccobacillus porphyridii TaxID=2597270 RepID=A0A554A2N4_9BACI|nr:hypothetical protein [Alkalicoccobacillus porphyridii]TSB47925.1 hypothetical protein FN960_05315 [Alkalicoccobacillus porphyridii]